MAQDQPAEPSAPKIKPSENRNADPDLAPRPAVPARRGSALLNFLSSLLGSKNPLAHAADSHKNTVWLFDNTAYQPVSDTPHLGHAGQSWQAEFVVCIFETEGRKDVGKLVAAIADHIGIDGEYGRDDQETRQRIEKRVQPFLDQVSPARTVKLEVTINGAKQTHSLGGSDRNGIISQIVNLGASGVTDGMVVRPRAQKFDEPAATMETRFAAPEGWMVISDIDDTIKRTMTREPTGILRTTFAEEPVPIAGMPEFYRHVQDEFNPTWFYLSASPYNLYPFLHQFLHEHYCHGTLILRDYSWMDISGLIKSFTENTQEYKVDRMEKIHSWFPKRRVLCIGDSTQKDPEAYAEMYNRYPGWIHAIAIRKVTDVEHMEEKNKAERFEEAFQNVPDSVWTIFEDSQELYAFVDGLGMEDQAL
jgi:phosphatidate phosphatase APP1